MRVLFMIYFNLVLAGAIACYTSGKIVHGQIQIGRSNLPIDKPLRYLIAGALTAIYFFGFCTLFGV